MHCFELEKGGFSLYLRLTHRKNPGEEVALLERALGPCGRRLGILSKEAKTWECSLTVCGERKIRTLNRRHRAKDRATDVLAFPVHEDLRFREPPAPVLNLGDIYVCHKIAAGQARDFGVSYGREVLRLFLHGWLHLLGHDHELSAKERKLMEREEQSLMEEICGN